LNYSLLPAPDVAHQYFPLDIPAWKAPLRFVDCGAFDGDTLLNFQKSNISLETVSAFEPDENNFRKLAQFIHANQEYFSSVNLWPCGVSSSTRQFSFDVGKGEASAVSLAGSSVIQCVSLDEAIPTFLPNLIKMDIEGAEPDALYGARNLIKASRPGLAISIYHRPEHLWQIPLLIENIAKGQYQYYLRAHAFNDFDVVLYAIPN
jgi:FkbM family methyltransferase